MTDFLLYWFILSLVVFVVLEINMQYPFPLPIMIRVPAHMLMAASSIVWGPIACFLFLKSHLRRIWR